MDTRTSLWLVTPALQRYALAEVCFDQWKQVSAALARRGIDLCVVVVADDENLDIARAAGFDTLEQNNDRLGRRFNDGIEYACRHGADWVAPIGSDTWIAPDYFDPLPEPHESRRTRLATVVRYDRLAELFVTNIGVGPFLYHRTQLAPTGFRPAEDALQKGIDTSTMLGVAEHHDLVWDERNVSPYYHIGFRGKPHMTRYSALWRAYGQRELFNPWEVLAEHFPVDLVRRAQDALRPELQAVA